MIDFIKLVHQFLSAKKKCERDAAFATIIQDPTVDSIISRGSEDFKQDIIVYLLTHMDGWEPARGGFYTWINWQVKHVQWCDKKYRTAQRRDESHNVHYSDSISEQGSPLEAMVNKEIVAMANKFLKRVLTPMEAKSLLKWLKGEVVVTDRHYKSMDNAINRAIHKKQIFVQLRNYFEGK